MEPSITERTCHGIEANLDKALTVKACEALLQHLQNPKREGEGPHQVKSPLQLDDAPSDESIWLLFSTKKHIVMRRRLKPIKIPVPHALNLSPALSICLIVPNPQRAFKSILAHPSCPIEISKRINRVIDVKKLEKKYHSFELKRQLKGSYDLFLADDRIITILARILGKTFYNSSSKRPIPICLRPRKSKDEKNKTALSSGLSKTEETGSISVVDPPKFAQEIEHALRTTVVTLSPSATTTIRVGLTALTANELADNVEAVTGTLVEKFLPKRWKSVKAIHIKGPSSMALPIWLAKEMWEDDAEVLEDAEFEEPQRKPKKRRREKLEWNSFDRKQGEQDDKDIDHSGSNEKRKREI